MYRKHLKNMEKSESRTGIKTIDRLSEIPVVNSALTNVTDMYEKAKEKNVLLRTSFNLAELSFKTMAFAATPITSLVRKPILSVDNYLCEKVDELEHTYPSISKPTEQITGDVLTQAKEMYEKTLKQPIDTLTNMKDKTVSDIKTMGNNTVQAVKNYGYETINKSADLGVRTVDRWLENRYAKILTDPLLSFTERSIDYWLPLTTEQSLARTSAEAVESTTLRRIYDINNRLYSRLYQSTFTQLNILHTQFESTIKRMQALKELMEWAYSGSKERFTTTKNTLVSQCAAIINKNNMSLERIEAFAKNYSKTILADVTQMLDKYMGLVKNFPVVFNGSKLKLTIENLINQMNKESFSGFLTTTIDQLKKMNTALMSYTSQMYQVVSGGLTQLSNAKPTEIRSESTGTNTTASNKPTENNK